MMRALIKSRLAPGLELQPAPRPTAGTNEVLIKIRTTGICGTDLHIFNWDGWAQRHLRPPRIVGHEFVGEIVELGPGVDGYALGDRVTGEGHITCGVCRNCRAGKRHLCHRTVGIGAGRDGAFADYLLLPAFNLWPVHPDIPSQIAAIMDPLGNAVHSALSFDVVAEDVLITGAGPIGVMAAAVCRFIGARHIVVTDPNGYRRELARRMGASRAIPPGRDALEAAMAELRMSNGFDVGLEMSGHPDAFRDMVEHMYPGGRIALLGFLPAQTCIAWEQVIFNGLHLKGIYGREMFETWYKMTQLLRSGLDIAPVITHRFPVEEYAEAFAVVRSGECGKVLLEWN